MGRQYPAQGLSGSKPWINLEHDRSINVHWSCMDPEQRVRFLYPRFRLIWFILDLFLVQEEVWTTPSSMNVLVQLHRSWWRHMWTLWVNHGTWTAVAPTVLGVRVTLPSFCMSFRVFGEMIWSHEPLVTSRTSKPLLSCMCSQVSLELVRPSKPLPAEQPVTNKRSFSGMPSKVSFQVRGFTINFTTARDVAIMNIFFPKIRSGGSKSLSLLTVWTITGCSTRVSSLRSRRAYSCHRRTDTKRRRSSLSREHWFISILEHMWPWE